ncbi:MAG: peptidoglycan-binding protein [Anaerolineae bacterium]
MTSPQGTRQRPVTRQRRSPTPRPQTSHVSHVVTPAAAARHIAENTSAASPRDYRTLQHSVGNRAVAGIATEGGRVRQGAGSRITHAGAARRSRAVRARSRRNIIRRHGELGEGLLRQGSTGPEVEELQRLLNQAGAEPPLEVDGIFGPATHAAVIDFQRSHGLDPDGIVGPLTGEQLYAFGPESSDETAQAVVANNIEGSESPEEELSTGYPLALELHSAGRYEEALALFERFYSLPELEENRSIILFDMGECYMRLGQPESAIERFQELLLYPLGDVTREQVLEMLRRARAGEELPPPDDVLLPDPTTDQRAAADAIAEREIALGDSALDTSIETAREHYWAAYNQGAASAGNRSYATRQLGVCSQYLREFDRAIGYYQEALGFPGVSEEERFAVVEQIRQCRLDEVGRTEPPAPITPEQAEAIELTAVEAFGAGQYQTALEAYQSIYRNPDAPVENRKYAAYWSGECHQRLRQFDRAIPMYEETLLFPGVTEDDVQIATERIRQCRNGELGPHVEPGAPMEDVAPGDAELLYVGRVYFETGSAQVGGIGYSTLYEISNLLREEHRATPRMTFQLDLIGGASRRWRGAGDTEQARRNNEILSGERADTVKVELEGLLPAEDVEAGVYPIDPRAAGDSVADALGMDSDDNTWTMREVMVMVFGTRTSIAEEL